MNYNKTIILSHFLNVETPAYGGGLGFFKERLSSIAKGSSSNSEQWTFPNHLGTHLDLPAHFSLSGKNLSHYVGDNFIFHSPFLLQTHLSQDELLVVTPLLEQIPIDCDFLIIKSGYQSFRGSQLFWSNNPGISPDIAIWLREKRPNVRAIGFDFISLTAYAWRDIGRKAHREFLAPENGDEPILIVEDMKLNHLTVSPKMIVLAPLLVEDADGSPVTVVAFLD